MGWGYGRKKVFWYGESLAVKCLRDGSLDVCLKTGRVTGVGGKPRKLKTDKNGYRCFLLQREVRRGGKKFTEVTKRGTRRERRRKRMWVAVHRLVLIKALAVEKFGDAWRENVRDLPKGIDVDHANKRRTDNRRENLRLATEAANRGKREMTDDEAAAVADAVDECYAEVF